MSYENEQELPQYHHREKMKKTVAMMLGYPSVDIEIEDEQMEVAIDNAVSNYRAWSSASKEEAFLHLKLLQSQSVYSLPNEVEIVRKVLRRGNGVTSGGNTVDPFSLAYSNTYLLSAVRGSTGGGLLTYDLYHQFDKTVGHMFGREITFTYNPSTKKLLLERDIRGDEDVLLHVYQNRPEHMLFDIQSIYPWLRDWVLAECMMMIGRARGKFGAVVGPQGTITMDGDAMRSEGAAMMESLKTRLHNFEDGGQILGFIIG